MRKLPENHIWINEPDRCSEGYKLGYYFADETARFVGPFETFEHAKDTLDAHIQGLEEGSK